MGSEVPPYLCVLGVAQDGGHPHIGCRKPCCTRVVTRHLPSCIAICDPSTAQSWLLDATPALPEQLDRLREHVQKRRSLLAVKGMSRSEYMPARSAPTAACAASASALECPPCTDDAVSCETEPASPAAPLPADDFTLAGILLTHAHIGHYAGLMYLGREALGAHGLPLYVLPRMAAFLTANGPWAQLVSLGNVSLRVGSEAVLSPSLTARALLVPHRGEYSETVGWVIAGPTRTALYLPDIDSWHEWQLPLEGVIASVDIAWLDGTFWADGELDRDMAEVPHPRMSATVDRLRCLPVSERGKVRFIHLNHTNPALQCGSAQAAAVAAAGMHIAVEGEVFSL